MNRMPTLFVSHGSPTFALEPGQAGRELAAFAAALPRPKAIVVASPHWMTREPTLTSTVSPQTIHDFGGFPAPLYDIQYPAPGAPDWAGRAASLLVAAGFSPQLDARRGLDHGAWVPLLHMYPDADVPVLQVSIQPRLAPHHFFALGQALAPLRDEGVLIVGSGSITHNLYEFRGADGHEAPYVHEFTDWIADALQRGDIDALLDYRQRAPHAARAHPTDEHLMPLLVALGAAGDTRTTTRLATGDVRYGMLAMDAFAFETPSA